VRRVAASGFLTDKSVFRFRKLDNRSGPAHVLLSLQTSGTFIMNFIAYSYASFQTSIAVWDQILFRCRASGKM